jgi:phospholipase C
MGSLHGVSILDFHGLDRFAADLQQPYPWPYTFIEPNYGDFNTYAGGSSQHPMDDVYGGERLLAAVVEAIQQSPYWESSVLIVCYDEHGGFYDHVPGPDAVPPGDNPDYGLNQHRFDFSKLGVRVPAMIVSPLADAGIDHTVYDHSSVCKFLEELWGLKHLTERDRAAKSPLSTLRDIPRDLHIDLPHPMPPVPRTATDRADRPLPSSGNVVGSLSVVRKIEAELAARFPAAMAQAAVARAPALCTFADAEAYAARVMAMVRLAKQLSAK